MRGKWNELYSFRSFSSDAFEASGGFLLNQKVLEGQAATVCSAHRISYDQLGNGGEGTAGVPNKGEYVALP